MTGQPYTIIYNILYINKYREGFFFLADIQNDGVEAISNCNMSGVENGRT